MNPANQNIVEIQVNAPAELLTRLRAAFEDEEQYVNEEDLFTYALLLGFHLEELRRCGEAPEGDDPEAFYQEMYEELARLRAAYAQKHYSFAEAARDYQTGKFANPALRREIAATKNALIPNLRNLLDQLRRRRDALLRTLEGSL